MRIYRPIAIAVTLFVILLIVFFLVTPEYKKFRSLQTELAEKTAEYNAQVAYYSAIHDTFLQLQNHTDDLKKIDDALPQVPALGQLIFTLQEIAAQNGMLVKSLALSKAGNGAQAKTSTIIKDVAFSMTMAGDYPSLENFLIALEKSDRVFEITNISFGSSAQISQASSNTATASQAQTQQAPTFSLQIKTHSY